MREAHTQGPKVVRVDGIPEPATGFRGETSGRRLNLTGSYGVLKLLSKENLVRIVNSQLQSFQSSKGGGDHGKKRDLIDVISGRSEAGRAPRRDLTVTQGHSGLENQTAPPGVSPVTNLDPGANHSVHTRPDPFSQSILVLVKGKDKLEMRPTESILSSGGGGGVSGTLRMAVPDLVCESQDQFLVVLQAKDMGGHLGGLSGTTTVTVRLTDVNDNPPRFTQSMWSFSVSELAIPGAEVGRISASDTDVGENARLEYTILEGETGDTFNITGVNQEAVIVLNKASQPTAQWKNSGAVRSAETRERSAELSASDPEALLCITPDSGLITTAMELERECEREHWHNITIITTQSESSTALNFTVGECGGPTARLVLIFHLQPMSRSTSSSSISSTLTLYVPLVLRDGTSG
ncbi:hypothetical protein NHX12_004717, partial [Muraenolepis orangiensis]